MAKKSSQKNKNLQWILVIIFIVVLIFFVFKFIFAGNKLFGPYYGYASPTPLATPSFSPSPSLSELTEVNDQDVIQDETESSLIACKDTDARDLNTAGCLGLYADAQCLNSVQENHRDLCIKGSNPRDDRIIEVWCSGNSGEICSPGTCCKSYQADRVNCWGNCFLDCIVKCEKQGYSTTRCRNSCDSSLSAGIVGCTTEPVQCPGTTNFIEAGKCVCQYTLRV